MVACVGDGSGSGSGGSSSGGGSVRLDSFDSLCMFSSQVKVGMPQAPFSIAHKEFVIK